jgi:TonB family protein
MRRSIIIAALLLAACDKEVTQPTDTANDVRQAIAVEYVKVPDLEIRTQPKDDAAIIAKYSAGSSVSVLSRKGDWVEVRVADGSGWAREAGLQGAADAKATESTSTEPRFLTAPSPITSAGAHGEIVFEADVSPDGQVINVRTILNTTGSPALASQNGAALQRARFYPIVKHGQRLPFTYEYRVHY